ncbi:helix-turn-helix domain-containing protein [Candidatus Pyrohabitans sp.]
MHFSNYISMRLARACVERGVRKLTLTPTALKQTPEDTLSFLRDSGVEVEVVASRGRPRKLDEEKVRRILAMRKAGVSFYRIASALGIPKSTVFDYFKRYPHLEVTESEVEMLQVSEARRVLKSIAGGSFDEEIREIAKRGLAAESREELEYYLQELLLCLNGE